MFDISEESFYPCELVMRMNGELNIIDVTNGSCLPERCGELIDSLNERIVLVQFTGLKDKNGEEIYEGDIVFYTKEREDYNETFQGLLDYWKDEPEQIKEEIQRHTGIVSFDITTGLYEGLDSSYMWWDAAGWCDKDHYEVIGNIYENPQLLEVNDG